MNAIIINSLPDLQLSRLAQISVQVSFFLLIREPAVVTRYCNDQVF